METSIIILIIAFIIIMLITLTVLMNFMMKEERPISPIPQPVIVQQPQPQVVYKQVPVYYSLPSYGRYTGWPMGGFNRRPFHRRW